MVGRFAAAGALRVEVYAAGDALGTLTIPLSGWAELSIEIPRASTGPATRIEVRAVEGVDPEPPPEAPSFGSMHYWFYEGE